MFDIQQELKKLPESPGVYIMKDENDHIIYVGKAKVLKNRVRQYFQNNINHSAKVKSMVSHIARFEYIVTGSDVEALILENNLIKKHSPKYNIMLKDDKTYPYIKVTTNEMYPRVFMTRQHLKDKAKYFGPFTSNTAVSEIIELVHKIYPLRHCIKKFPKDFNKERPCLNYHIGQCKAPCNSLVSVEEYEKMVEGVIDFLNGNTQNAINMLKEQMLKASDELEFEKAAEIRNTIMGIEKLNQKQFTENLSQEDKDVIGFARQKGEAVVQVFFIRGGKLTGREHFYMNELEDIDDTDFIEEFVKQFYSGTPFIPQEIILQCNINDFDIISQWLSEQKGQRVSILVPQKGERYKLLKMAVNNAEITFDKTGERLKNEHNRTIGALKELQAALGVDFELNRIESYDISNTQGFESVGSMVVFEKGKAKYSDYRKFKIKTVIGPDDYASMYEVITRRFMRFIDENSENPENKKAGFDKLPDIIFMDGGKGQISSALKALEDLDISVPVCGMVKDDRHRTRGLLFNDREIVLSPHSEGFKLVTRIQDEVHRFAIEYHRKLREKKQIHSVLDDIKGIGEVRRKALMKHFGDIEKIRLAQVEELAQVQGMDIKSAQNVYNFFRNIGNQDF